MLIGLTSDVLNDFTPHALQGLTLARVAFRNRERCRLWTEAGETGAEISGALWYRSASGAELPAVGDWVAARIVGSDEALIEAVLQRKTCFSRRAAGTREVEQVIAANIDIVFLVMGLDGDYSPRRLERYLVLAAESGAKPVIVLNKADVCASLEDRLAETRLLARGAPVETASAATGEIDGIRRWLAPDRTIALLGSSGVGKSTIVNALLGEERQRVNQVREDDSRGRHTTTARELVGIPGGGALIDTPGMRELQLWSSEESVSEAFEDVSEAARDCRYRDCSHSGEEGCAIPGAVLEGRLSEERLESYRKLLGEVRHHEVMTDVFARQRQKQKWKAIHKAQRAQYKFRERQ